MTVEEFAYSQHNQRRFGLSSLFQSCLRRFLLAGRLVGLGGPVFKRMGDAAYSGNNTDLGPLCPAWEVICERYRTERFDPQPSLFKDHETEVSEIWGQFLYRELFPLLLRDDEFVRNVLRAIDLLPCRSKQKAASALSQYLEEMSLPCGPPIWDDAETELL